MISVDDAIVQAYQELDTPADQLLVNGERAQGFVDVVSKLTNAHLGSDRILRRLLTMRKKGKLPRLRR